MKELYVSNYSLESIYDYVLSEAINKEIDISNFSIESIYDYIFIETLKKEIILSYFSIEVLYPYIETTTVYSYGFFGEVFENITKVERYVLSYDQTTLLLNGYATSIDGTFLLQQNSPETCFLICKDDATGESYNNLIISSVLPVVLNNYGLVFDNPGLSAKDIKLNNPAATFDGLYWIKLSGQAEAVQIFCDMTTQGGGWTMCTRWDRDFPAGSRYLPLNAMRTNIDINNMIYTNILCTTQTSTVNIIPLITAGATMFMHVSLNIGDVAWKHIYFSEIYQAVLDNPSNIFDSSFDTNAGSSAGTVVRSSYSLKNRWFDYNMVHPLSATDLSSNLDYYLDGGPGQAMFTINNDTGASYSSHSGSTCSSSTYTRVFWGFPGKDSSLPSNDNNTKQLVGTYSNSTSPPNCRFNLMFIR